MCGKNLELDKFIFFKLNFGPLPGDGRNNNVAHRKLTIDDQNKTSGVVAIVSGEVNRPVANANVPSAVESVIRTEARSRLCPAMIFRLDSPVETGNVGLETGNGVSIVAAG